MSLPPDPAHRCAWCADTPELQPYHDQEWGFPVADDRRLFEKICLEGFQSGLSWRTVLLKRPRFREVFLDFDFHALTQFGEQDVLRLLQDPGIIRHRGKIEATLRNAHQAVALQQAFGSLAAYFWRYEIPPHEAPAPQTVTYTTQSVAMSKDLKRRGWRFVGPTTLFAFMQSMGLLNDHAMGCATRQRVAQARATFTPPR